MGVVIKQAGKLVYEPASQLHLYAEGGTPAHPLLKNVLKLASYMSVCCQTNGFLKGMAVNVKSIFYCGYTLWA